MSPLRHSLCATCVLILAACGGSGSVDGNAGTSNAETGNGGSSVGSSFSFTPKGDQSRGAQDYAWNQQQGLDQQAHPDYNSRTAPLIPTFFEGSRDIFRDPYHFQWLEDGRGTYEATSFLNRYGASLHVDLYGPPDVYVDRVTGQPDAGPYPVVLLLPGYAADVLLYEGFAQQLAENGYIVVVITPQGQAPSETDPNPMEVYCDPEGEWREPQEGGIRETGECAGYDSLPEGDGGSQFGQGWSDEEAQAWMDAAEEVGYKNFRHVYVFAALDAANWLTDSGIAPWTGRMDFSRMGIVGHSAGSDGALIAANVDPQQRFDVVAAWDGYGRPDFVDLTVPTLFQFGEQQPGFGPYPVAWDPFIHTAVFNALQLFESGVPMMALGLRGSSHSEWHYVPYRLQNPVAPFTNVSAKGFQVAFYYNLAWLDYHLKAGSLVQQQDAERRLLARVFDDSVDWTSISTGTYDPTARYSNSSYMIGGEPITDHITVWYPNFLSFGGHVCEDWYEGCPVAE